MRRRLYRRILRIRRNFDPVVLGQTKTGFILAAVLVVLWWVGTDAKAELTNPGSSENSYFRLDWTYDLTHGNGNFILKIKNPTGGNLYDNLRVGGLSFKTLGVPFSNTDIQMVDGQVTNVYHFPDYPDTEKTFYLVNFSTTQFHAESQTQIQFNMTFPTTGVALLPTQLSLSADFPVGHYMSSMEFLTVQSIPEPSSIATIALGAAGAIGGLWRKERKD